jgi:uncharacterized protein YfaP (DUF2135 family)
MKHSLILCAGLSLLVANCTIVTKHADDEADEASPQNDAGGDDAPAADDETGEDEAQAPSQSPDAAVSDAGAGGDGGGVSVVLPGRDDAEGTDGGELADASDALDDAGLVGDGGSVEGDSGVPAQVVTDPAPDAIEPGESTCEGCPDSDIGEFEVIESNSSHVFEGNVTGAEGNGQFYIETPSGAAISGPIATDESGNYSFTAPLFCGVQLVKSVWTNQAGSYVVVTEVTREGCVDADIQLTLSWDDLGRDFELHLIKPGGALNDNATDCTWTSCIGTGPDWGVQGEPSDDPVKDVDNVGNFGPENIFLVDPEPGIYTVMVEHWGVGDPEADGQLTFNVAGKTTVVNVENLSPQHVWSVGTVTWPSGDVKLDGDIIDCTADWASGCRLPLPEIQ